MSNVKRGATRQAPDNGERRAVSIVRGWRYRESGKVTSRKKGRRQRNFDMSISCRRLACPPSQTRMYRSGPDKSASCVKILLQAISTERAAEKR